jgi:hypothetical protein
VVLQQALADLNTADRNSFATLAGRRKMPGPAGPGFRSGKDRRQAIRLTANARFKVLASGKLRLPNIGDVPVRWSPPLPPQPSRVTVYLSQWRHAGEAARLPDAPACRSTGSARTRHGSAAAPNGGSVRLAGAGAITRRWRSLTNHDIPVRASVDRLWCLAARRGRNLRLRATTA